MYEWASFHNMAEGKSLFGMTGNSLPGVQLQSTPDLHFDFP